MKKEPFCKKLSILTVFLVFLSQLAFGQNNRVCDISVNLLSPQNGFTLTSPGTDSCYVALKNLGPDSIFALDQYSITLKFGGFRYLPYTQEYGQHLAPGDSVIVSFQFELKGTNDADGVDFCIFSVVSFTPTAAPYRPLMLEKDSAHFLDNNSGCVTGFHRMRTSSVYEKIEKNVLIFPNPATTEVRIKALANHRKISCRIHDTTGKSVLDISDFQSMEAIDVSMLSCGLYYVKFESAGFVQIGKFVKE